MNTEGPKSRGLRKTKRCQSAELTKTIGVNLCAVRILDNWSSCRLAVNPMSDVRPDSKVRGVRRLNRRVPGVCNQNSGDRERGAAGGVVGGGGVASAFCIEIAFDNGHQHKISLVSSIVDDWSEKLRPES